MDEYIKRKDALEILQSRLDGISQMSYLNMDWHELDIMCSAIENAIDDIGEVPSADVQPIQCGQWENEYLDDDVWWAECTNCKNDIHSRFGRVSSYTFCPNCGAKMIKDGDTGEHNEVNRPDGNCLDCKFQYLEDSDYWCSICPGNPEDI